MRLPRLTALGLTAALTGVWAASAASHRDAGVQPIARRPLALSAAYEHPLLISLPVRAVAAPAKPVPTSIAAPSAVTVRRPLASSSAPIPKQDAAPTPAPAPKPVQLVRDGYPYRTSQTNDRDAWGFTQRQCVSYVAWRLAQSGHPISNDLDGWGSASGWDETAQRLGMTVDSVPTLGAVAHWNPRESSRTGAAGSTGLFTAGDYGHVAYVTQVFGDGSVQVDQYNATGTRAFSTMRLRAPRFLHVR